MATRKHSTNGNGKASSNGHAKQNGEAGASNWKHRFHDVFSRHRNEPTIYPEMENEPRWVLDEVYERELCHAAAKEEWDNLILGGKEKIRTATMEDAARVVGNLKFLLDGWIPYGYCTMVLGGGGQGKSSFVLGAIVKPIIEGGNWFTGQKGFGTPRNVLWCDTENRMQINLDRISRWGLPRTNMLLPFDSPLASVNLCNPEHLERIEEVVTDHQPECVIIDSLRGSHKGDENSSQMATVLKGLSEMAERTGTAVIVVHHTGKPLKGEEISQHSSRGSAAIVDGVVSQLLIDQPRSKEDPWRRLQMGKKNIGVDPGPIGFQITDTGLEFGPAPEKLGTVTQEGQAREWLKRNMKPGQWCKAKPLLEEAKGDGFSDNAIQRARQELGIMKPNVRKTGDGWEWLLPRN